MTLSKNPGFFSTQSLLPLGILLTVFGMTGVVAGPFHGKQQGKHTRAAVQMAGIAAPHQMVRIEEHNPFAVPKGKIFVATGIITTEKWTADSSVEIHFDGQTVFKRGMLTGEVVALPPGLAAGPGTLVDIDRISAATDARVTLLGYLGDAL